MTINRFECIIVTYTRGQGTMAKISKASHNLLEDFAQSAKDWGWMEDQGYGKDVRYAEDQFSDTKEALEKRIAKLESQVTDLRKKSRLAKI